MENNGEISLLLDGIWEDLQSAKERMLDLKRELLLNREYGVNNNKKFDELLFAYEQLTSAINHYSYCADNIVKILDL